MIFDTDTRKRVGGCICQGASPPPGGQVDRASRPKGKRGGGRRQDRMDARATRYNVILITGWITQLDENHP